MANDYQVKTEIFSGPIELLLYLARKNEVDIFDVPLARITDDYLNYIKQAQSFNIEISADFLLMAVVLIRFKMWRLLPSTADAEQVPETVSLDDIVAEFKKYASVAGLLSDLELKRLQFFPRRGQIVEELPEAAGNIYVLISAFQKVLENNLPRATLEIAVPELKLEDKLNELRELFLNKPKISFFVLVESTRNLIEVIITFIALLELIRLGEIHFTQESEFAEIIFEKQQVLDSTAEQV